MAINQITFPSGTAPIDNGDWTDMINSLLGAQGLADGNSILTDFEATVSAPSIAQGTFIRHSGNFYKVESSDATISGTPAAGLNYVKLSVSGTTLLASWVTTFTGYTWNPAYAGWYSGTDQIIMQGVYLDGSDYIRFVSPNNQKYQFQLADGRKYIADRDLLLNGSDLLTGGGAVLTGGGAVNAGTGLVTCGALSGYLEYQDIDLGDFTSSTVALPSLSVNKTYHIGYEGVSKLTTGTILSFETPGPSSTRYRILSAYGGGGGSPVIQNTGYIQYTGADTALVPGTRGFFRISTTFNNEIMCGIFIVRVV